METTNRINHKSQTQTKIKHKPHTQPKSEIYGPNGEYRERPWCFFVDSAMEKLQVGRSRSSKAEDINCVPHLMAEVDPACSPCFRVVEDGNPKTPIMRS